MVKDVVNLQFMGSILFESRKFWVFHRRRKRLVDDLAVLVVELCYLVSALFYTHERGRLLGRRFPGIYRLVFLLASPLWHDHLFFKFLMEQEIRKQTLGGSLGIRWICKRNLVLLSDCLFVGVLSAFAHS